MSPDVATRIKWDRAAATFDLMSGYGPEWRWHAIKAALFANMREDANILFLAAGTGLEFALFPHHRSITAIDISPAMLRRAEPRAAAYQGHLQLAEMDVHDMAFPDEQFDQIFSSCTFCSVPDPVSGLEALHRVLKRGGELYMFEHTGSRWFPFNVMMNLMTPLTRAFGPEMNRDTPTNAVAAGFAIDRIDNVFLDVVKTIYATKRAEAA